MFREMQQQGVQPDVATYRSLVNAFALVNQPGQALEMMREMQRHGLQPDVVAYNPLTTASERDPGAASVLPAAMTITAAGLGADLDDWANAPWWDPSLAADPKKQAKELEEVPADAVPKGRRRRQKPCAQRHNRPAAEPESEPSHQSRRQRRAAQTAAVTSNEMPTPTATSASRSALTATPASRVPVRFSTDYSRFAGIGDEEAEEERDWEDDDRPVVDPEVVAMQAALRLSQEGRVRDARSMLRMAEMTRAAQEELMPNFGCPDFDFDEESTWSDVERGTVEEAGR